MFRGIRIWQIVIAAIAFPIIAGAGIGILQTNQYNRTFKPQGIQFTKVKPTKIKQQKVQPRQVQQQQIQPQHLSAARNLKGSWHGTAKFIFYATSNSYCYIYFNVVLLIQTQTGNVVTGAVNVEWDHAVQQQGSINCTAFVPTTNDPVRGTITGSRLYLTAGQQGAFTGSFTGDTITLNQPHASGTDGLVGSIKFGRQHN